MAYNPYTSSTFKQQTVETYTKSEMLIALYDGTLLNLNKAMLAIDSKDIGAANTALQKSQKIVRYLIATLDMNYPISFDLKKLYTFIDEQIGNANIKKDKMYIEDVLPMVSDLKDSFQQADKLSRSSL